MSQPNISFDRFTSSSRPPTSVSSASPWFAASDCLSELTGMEIGSSNGCDLALNASTLPTTVVDEVAEVPSEPDRAGYLAVHASQDAPALLASTCTGADAAVGSTVVEEDGMAALQPHGTPHELDHPYGLTLDQRIMQAANPNLPATISYDEHLLHTPYDPCELSITASHVTNLDRKPSHLNAPAVAAPEAPPASASDSLLHSATRRSSVVADATTDVAVAVATACSTSDSLSFRHTVEQPSANAACPANSECNPTSDIPTIPMHRTANAVNQLVDCGPNSQPSPPYPHPRSLMTFSSPRVAASPPASSIGMMATAVAAAVMANADAGRREREQEARARAEANIPPGFPFPVDAGAGHAGTAPFTASLTTSRCSTGSRTVGRGQVGQGRPGKPLRRRRSTEIPLLNRTQGADSKGVTRKIYAADRRALIVKNACGTRPVNSSKSSAGHWSTEFGHAFGANPRDERYCSSMEIDDMSVDFGPTRYAGPDSSVVPELGGLLPGQRPMDVLTEYGDSRIDCNSGVEYGEEFRNSVGEEYRTKGGECRTGSADGRSECVGNVDRCPPDTINTTVEDMAGLLAVDPGVGHLHQPQQTSTLRFEVEENQGSCTKSTSDGREDVCLPNSRLQPGSILDDYDVSPVSADINPEDRNGKNRVFNPCRKCGKAKHIRTKYCKVCYTPKGPVAKRRSRSQRGSVSDS